MKTINGTVVSGNNFFLLVEYVSSVTITDHLIQAIWAWEVE